MIIKFKSKKDFNTAVTYLINQTFCFDQHDTSNSLRFFIESSAERAMSELSTVHNITSVFEEDLLPAIA
jgi:hypothetical protein